MISVVVVNFNGAGHLERCLGSLPWNLGEDLEAIVVDNASTDGSAALVRGRFPGVEVIELAKNEGFGAAVNRGAAAARGDRLLLLNNDAWLEVGCLERLAARLDGEPRLAWVAPRLVYPDGRPQTHWTPTLGVAGEAAQLVRNRLERWAWNHGGLARLWRLGDPGWYTAACALLRRAAFDAVGGFDPGYFLYFEDADLAIRLRHAGWRLAEEPAARAVHVSAGGARDGAVEVEYRRSQLRYYARHRPAWELRWLRRRLARKYALPDDEVAARIRGLLAERPARHGQVDAKNV